MEMNLFGHLATEDVAERMCVPALQLAKGILERNMREIDFEETRNVKSYYNDLHKFAMGEAIVKPNRDDYDWEALETYYLGFSIVKPWWVEFESEEYFKLLRLHFKDYWLDEVSGDVTIYHYTPEKNVESVLENGVTLERMSPNTSFHQGFYFYSKYAGPCDLVCLKAEYSGTFFKCIGSYSDEKDNPENPECFMFENFDMLRFSLFNVD